MIVVVAEKPSVGRDIARVLRCSQKGEGFIRGENYLVTWAIGHLIELCNPDELDEKYKKWNFENLPILPDYIPTKVISQTKKQFTILKKIFNDPETEKLICATDAGREGELIFRLIYQQAKCKKPVDRLWISSMTDAAIQEGFSQLKPSSDYDGLYRSANCRSQADWLIGMNASRAFSIRFHVLLSIGRVQTPTLAILVKRLKEIENFVPEEYYTVTAQFGGYSGVWINESIQDEKKASRIATKEQADAIVKAVKGKDGTVVRVDREKKKELPPLLYDLTSLQREANKKLGFTADKTLKIAQELYEKWKAVTYPRTDSRYLPMDMLERTATTLRKLPTDYQHFVQNLPWQEGGNLPISKRIFDDTKISDHHALIPTAQRIDFEKLPADAAKLYDMIARKTIAAFYPAHEYDAIRVITKVENHAFKSLGRVVTVQGWKTLYNADEKNEDVLPPLQVSDVREVIKVNSKKDATKPPLPHTDASLLAGMENAGKELEDETLREQMKGSGLGTPATRAAIIERLIQVGYASRKGKSIIATEKGVKLIEIVPQEISSPETTGKWELALNEIAQNKRDTERFMQGIRNMSCFLVDFAQKTDSTISFPEEPYKKGKRTTAKINHTSKEVEHIVCPLCGKAIVENEKAFGCADWKNGCPFTLWKNCLVRGGGPELQAKLLQLIMTKKTLQGSTGTIQWIEESKLLQFFPNGAQIPSVSVSAIFHKKSSNKG